MIYSTCKKCGGPFWESESGARCVDLCDSCEERAAAVAAVWRLDGGRYHHLRRIADGLAIDVKASGIDDLGCHFDEDWGLSEIEWTAVCEEVRRILPFTEVSAEARAEWARAAREHAAEQRAERLAFAGDQ